MPPAKLCPNWNALRIADATPGDLMIIDIKNNGIVFALRVTLEDKLMLLELKNFSVFPSAAISDHIALRLDAPWRVKMENDLPEKFDISVRNLDLGSIGVSKEGAMLRCQTADQLKDEVGVEILSGQLFVEPEGECADFGTKWHIEYQDCSDGQWKAIETP